MKSRSPKVLASPVLGSRDFAVLFFAKTPHTKGSLIHVTCYTASLYVIDFTRALNFGEAHPKRTDGMRRQSYPKSICHARLEVWRYGNSSADAREFKYSALSALIPPVIRTSPFNNRIAA